jgi:hypothetical protein
MGGAKQGGTGGGAATRPAIKPPSSSLSLPVYNNMVLNEMMDVVMAFRHDVDLDEEVTLFN